MKLTSEESCQRTNWKTKCKLESQNPLGNNGASLPWVQLCQCHLRTIVRVSLGNSRVILTREQLRQCHLGTIVPVSLRSNCTSLTWEQSCQWYLGAIVPVSPGNNCAIFTWGQNIFTAKIIIIIKKHKYFLLVLHLTCFYHRGH